MLLLAAASGVLGGCTGGDTPSDARPSTSRAPDPVADYLTLVHRGTEQLTTARVRVAVRAGGVEEVVLRGVIDHRPATPAVAATVTGLTTAHAPAQIRYVDGVLHLQADDIAGGTFVRLGTGQDSGLGADLAGMLDRLDPAAATAEFEDAVVEVHLVPARGKRRDLQHFWVRMAAPGDTVPEESGAPATTMHLWLDEFGRVHRATTRTRAHGTSVITTTRLYDFGLDVAIEAPPG